MVQVLWAQHYKSYRLYMNIIWIFSLYWYNIGTTKESKTQKGMDIRYKSVLLSQITDKRIDVIKYYISYYSLCYSIFTIFPLETSLPNCNI